MGRARAVVLPAVTHSAGRARQITRDVLAFWGLPHLTDTAVLLVSELVTNAVRHGAGGATVTLRLETRGAWLRLEVHDGDPRQPQRRTPAGLDESGFGLVLVGLLAARWGTDRAGTGKAVWAELPTGQDGEAGG